MLPQRLEDINFADDLVLIAQTTRHIQESLRLLLKYARKVRSKINGAKTKLVHTKTSALCTLVIEGEAVKEVERRDIDQLEQNTRLRQLVPRTHTEDMLARNH